MKHDAGLQELTGEIRKASAFLDKASRLLSERVIGQNRVLERVYIALLANGHILLEGVPGLAKTLIVRTFASAMNLAYRRIQFTPDMLPADLVGTMVYNPKEMEFYPRKGPVFANIILADEINRSPAKVQSALLEAMQERQVTIGDRSFPLPGPFMVLATQNPVEHEGTYLLPEAQLDRFMMKVIVDYPSYDEELGIVERSATTGFLSDAAPVVEKGEIENARVLIDRVYADTRVKRYIVDLVTASRNPLSAGLQSLEEMIEYGASPRASIFLLLAAKAHAFLRQRAYITPEDVKEVALDVLRHRIRPTYEAEADNVKPEDCIREILAHVKVP